MILSKTRSARRFLRKNEGFSLLEVVIFIAIIALVFLGISFATTHSLRRAKFNEQKIIATRYAEELEEWLRGEKETSWFDFVKRSSETPTIYCFNDSSLSWPSTGTCASTGTTYGLDNLYRREITLTTSNLQISAQIIVEWNDGPNVYSVPLNTVMRQWE